LDPPVKDVHEGVDDAQRSHHVAGVEDERGHERVL
jgi:hypothetical protein